MMMDSIASVLDDQLPPQTAEGVMGVVDVQVQPAHPVQQAADAIDVTVDANDEDVDGPTANDAAADDWMTHMDSDWGRDPADDGEAAVHIQSKVVVPDLVSPETHPSVVGAPAAELQFSCQVQNAQKSQLGVTANLQKNVLMFGDDGDAGDDMQSVHPTVLPKVDDSRAAKRLADGTVKKTHTQMESQTEHMETGFTVCTQTPTS
jgi:hypothetical protein